MALLAHGLLPASFRGVPFAATHTAIAGGRRVAQHQYPGRDDPWAEDMGRKARQWPIRGFIVDGDIVFDGGPIQLQRALLIAALEAKGPGILTHPTLGVVQASVLNFSVGEDRGAGVMSDVEIQFEESGKRNYPSILSTSTGLFSTANLLKAALAIDGVRLIAAAWSAGARREDLVTTAHLWGQQVNALGGDATALYRVASQLPGNYGRFAAGGNTGLSGQRPTIYSAQTQLSDLVAAAARQRAFIASTVAKAETVTVDADLNYATEVADAVTAFVQALADSCADPADAIRLLQVLVAFATNWPAATTPIGSAYSGMVRRAAIASLALAAAQYQPSSADDAAAKIALIAPIIDEQATLAADAGDDASFKALRAARAAVVQDLRARGATLPQIKTWRPGSALPALALAQRFYRDAGRADQLVIQARPIHPLFMPPEFEALAA